MLLYHKKYVSFYSFLICCVRIVYEQHSFILSGDFPISYLFSFAYLQILLLLWPWNILEMQHSNKSIKIPSQNSMQVMDLNWMFWMYVGHAELWNFYVWYISQVAIYHFNYWLYKIAALHCNTFLFLDSFITVLCLLYAVILSWDILGRCPNEVTSVMFNVVHFTLNRKVQEFKTLLECFSVEVATESISALLEWPVSENVCWKAAVV
jgi:hypothetical protein